MYPGCLKQEITAIGGAWPSADPYEVLPPNGLFSQNSRYSRGSAGTRFGHGTAGINSVIAASMVNWLPLVSGTPKSLLIFFTPSASAATHWVYDLSNSTLYADWSVGTSAPTGVGASYADAGARLYAAIFDSNGIGVYAALVYGGGSFGNWDLPFRGSHLVNNPILQTSTAINGNCTLGPHRLGFVCLTRSGYTTNVSPWDNSAGAFAPNTVTNVSPNTLITWNTQPYTWESDVVSIQMIMTPTTNLNQYYLVPGSVSAVNNGGITGTISISDADLIAQATPADNYFNQLAYTPGSPPGGTPPFVPSVIMQYLERLVYITVDQAGFPVAYASDPNNYQRVTAAQHGIYLPGNKRITAAFQLQRVLYLLGPHWTYSISDNGQTPVNWGGPQLVDGSIGTMCPLGVYVNPAQGFAWVVDAGGLYLFTGGQYPSKPISYYQEDDWNRINWAQAAKIKVVDDKDSKRAMVLVPLDGATNPSHVMTWDYTNGTDAESVMYSIFKITGYPYGSLAMVENYTTKILEPWYGPSSSGSIIRQKNARDTNPFRDSYGSDVAINWIHEFPLLPSSDADRSYINQHHGAHIRGRGAGGNVMGYTFYSPDHAQFYPGGALLNLSGAPGFELLAPSTGFPATRASLQLQVNALDAWALISGVTHYYTKGPLLL